MRQFSHQFCWKKTILLGSLTRNNFGSAKKWDDKLDSMPYHGSHAILIPFLHTAFIGNRKAFPYLFWGSAEPTKWKVNFRVKMIRVKGFWWLLLRIHYMNLGMICYVYWQSETRVFSPKLSGVRLHLDINEDVDSTDSGILFYNFSNFDETSLTTYHFSGKWQQKKQPHPLSVTFCTITGWPVVF